MSLSLQIDGDPTHRQQQDQNGDKVNSNSASILTSSAIFFQPQSAHEQQIPFARHQMVVDQEKQNISQKIAARLLGSVSEDENNKPLITAKEMNNMR